MTGLGNTISMKMMCRLIKLLVFIFILTFFSVHVNYIMKFGVNSIVTESIW